VCGKETEGKGMVGLLSSSLGRNNRGKTHMHTQRRNTGKKKKRKKWCKRTTLFSYLSGPGKEDGKVRNGWSRASCCRREEEGKRRSVRGEVCCE